VTTLLSHRLGCAETNLKQRICGIIVYTEPDTITFAATLGTTVIGAFAGAFLSSRFGYQQSALAESDRSQCQAADTAIPQLIHLRRLLRNAQTSRSTGEWALAAESAYEVLDDARPLLPEGSKHLKWSIRASIGEAMGAVAVADFDPQMLTYELSLTITAGLVTRWTT
jgi:hypothetical protein